jgi:glycosyltransferase involved in cell wall biosynthesis
MDATATVEDKEAGSPIAVTFLVNGEAGGAMGERACSFASRLSARFQTTIVYRHPRKLRAIALFLVHLWRCRPQVVYVLDMALSGVIAGAIDRCLRRPRLIIDTGDAIYELSKSIGRGRLGRLLTWLLEQLSFRLADHLVVRGSYHREMLAARGLEATFLPDGVDPEQFASTAPSDLRPELGLEDSFVVGLVGSSMWSETLQICYGWELVEAIDRLKDRPVRGVFVGDGSGIAHLKAACLEKGIESRILFLGRQPYERLPALLKVMDVCLSTQTNDVPGRVRTTGKLPLYLAAGRYVLASRVGEAARILPEEMLVDYVGVVDRDYPRRLAQRIEWLLDHPEDLGLASGNRRLAAEHFDYGILVRRLEALLVQVARGR